MTPPASVAESLLVHESFVRRLARNLAGNDGDDLAQDAWAAALQRDERDVRDATGWLATIVKNLWRNRRRDELRRAARERDASAPAGSPSIATILELEEARRHVVAAVVALPERLREVVLCRYYEDLDSTAIGERLGVPASTVRSRLRDAHEQLRSRLDAQHGDRRAWAVPLAGWCVPGRTGTVVLRTAASIRIAAGAVAVLLLAWWVAIAWQPAPPLPSPTPGGTVQLATRDDPSPAGASPRAEREAVASATTATIGPEDLPGRVIDATTGAPVVGAEIVLEHWAIDEFPDLDIGPARAGEVVGTARTGTDGRFVFRVRRALQHRVVANAPGFAKETLPCVTGGSEIVVRLTAPASITGVVRRKVDGVPLADVLVEAVESDGSGTRTSAQTAADGTFALGGLIARTVSVVTRSTGLKKSWQTFELTPGAVKVVDIELENGHALRGVVRDGVTKQPLAGARVATDWRMRSAAETGLDGTFELPDAGDRDRLQVRADGYAPQVVFRAPGDRDALFDVSVFAGAAVVGRVVDAEARAVPEVRVCVATHIRHFDHEIAILWCSAEIGRDGAFRIDGVPLDGLGLEARHQLVRPELLLHAPGHGNRTIALSTERLRAGLLDVGNLVLERDAIIEGRVVEKDGTPVGGAEVQLDGLPRGFDSLVPDRTLLLPPLWFPRATRTAPDGAFRIGGLAAGTYSFRAKLGNEDLDVPSSSREITAGEIANVGDLRVDRGAIIGGVVRIAGVRALSSDDRIYVMACNEATVNRGARVRNDGSFRIDRLAPGTYTLQSIDVPKGFALAPRPGIATGTDDVELVLEPAASFEGVVVDADGRPVPRALLTFYPRSARVAHEVAADELGRFRVEAPSGVLGSLSGKHPDDQFNRASLPDIVAPQSGLVLQLRRGF